MRRYAGDAGITLVEMLVALAMTTLVFGAVLGALDVFQSDNRYNQLRNEAQDKARSAIDRLTGEPVWPMVEKPVSMLNTIHDGQFVLVDRLTPRFDPYHRGDIIVFQPPVSVDEAPDRKPFIKRVIGVAGDTVELRDGAVYVNGIALDEPYLFKVDGVAQPTEPESEATSWR